VAAVSGRRAATCFNCSGTLEGPRIVVAGLYLCPDCRYVAEYGESERAPERTKSSAPPQTETLFPVGPYLKGKGR
jgi:hypothetical protein